MEDPKEMGVILTMFLYTFLVVNLVNIYIIFFNIRFNILINKCKFSRFWLLLNL